MEDRREITRTRINRNVQIIVSDRLPPIKCLIRNFTTKGAGFSVPTTPQLPTTFIMSFDLWHSIRQCHMVWQNQNEVGVTFVR